MVKPFALQSVFDLAQSRTDEATLQLARLLSAERSAKDKLGLLQQYRDEYATRFQQAAQNGLSPHQWNNYQEFLGRIDEAIQAQGSVVTQHVGDTALGQTHWQQQNKKLKAFDVLSERHYSNENSKELKREQKNQDEFAARSIDIKESL